MDRDNLIFTLSGARGIIGKGFNAKIAKKIAISYGLRFKSEDKRVIVGKDTRPSGKQIEEAVIEGLRGLGFQIISLGVCPTPIIIHAKYKNNIPGGIIITASHNPQEWNGLKLLSGKNFLDGYEIEQIANSYQEIEPKSYVLIKKELQKGVNTLDPFPDYIHDLFNFLNYQGIREKNNLNIIIDPGGGTGKFAAPKILERMGCNIKVINENLLINGNFPRGIEPIEPNLRDLVMEVWQGKYDLGLAFDSDADRLAVIGENGVCYSEDIGLALIIRYYLKNNMNQGKKGVFVTNLASSLIFEVIAEKYNAQVIRTPIGERFLAEKMKNLIEEEGMKREEYFVLGGEGLCGGFMLPYFNNTRDGIFAAAKIIEILVLEEKKLSDLVADLPKFYSHREKISIKKEAVKVLLEQVKKELIKDGEEVVQIGRDLRFGKKKEWFVLIHPSNTEPVIRIISEANRNSLARVNCELTTELVRLLKSRL